MTNYLLILECVGKDWWTIFRIILDCMDLTWYHRKLDEILTQNQSIVSALTHIAYILIMIFSNFCTVPNIYMIEWHKTNIICCGQNIDSAIQKKIQMHIHKPNSIRKKEATFQDIGILMYKVLKHLGFLSKKKKPGNFSEKVSQILGPLPSSWAAPSHCKIKKMLSNETK